MKARSPRSSATRCTCCSARRANSPTMPQRAVACALELDALSQSFRDELARKGHRARRHPHRRPCRAGAGRQFRRRPLLRLHGLWRHDQHRGAARSSQQAARHAHLRQRKRRPDGSTDFRGRPVGDLVLRGRAEALRAFEPLRPEQYDDPSTASYLEAFAKLEAGDPERARCFRRAGRQALGRSARELPPQAAAERRQGNRISMD